MVAADGLAVEDPRAPDTRGFEAGGEIAVHQASHLDQSAAGWTGKGGSQIRRLARLLGVNANDMEEPVQGRAQLFQPRTVLRSDDVDGKTLAKHLAHDLQAI